MAKAAADALLAISRDGAGHLHIADDARLTAAALAA